MYLFGIKFKIQAVLMLLETTTNFFIKYKHTQNMEIKYKWSYFTSSGK